MKVKKGSKMEVFSKNGWFLTAEGKHMVEKVHKDDVRPKWILGDAAEVFDHNSWKLGKIAKVLKDNYFVIRLSGSIQLREFHISRLRVPHACHKQQSLAMGKVTGRSKQNQLADYACPGSRGELELVHRACETIYEEGCIAKGSEMSNVGFSSNTRNLKNNLESTRGMSPGDLVREKGKKRKAIPHKSHQPNKRPLPDKDAVADSYVYRPCSNKCSELAEINAGRRNSSLVPLRVIKEDDCSVASCSVNDLAYSNCDDRQSVGFTDCFPDDAMSPCPSTTGRKCKDHTGNELAANIHQLELQAYQSTVQAFYASGPLTWEQESLLTNLRLSLNISNEEHLLELRHLLS